MLRVILFFVHGSGVDEIAMPTLQESYNLSASMYAVPTLTLSSNQTYKLNVCWNSSVVRKVVRMQQMGVCEGRLDGTCQTQH